MRRSRGHSSVLDFSAAVTMRTRIASVLCLAGLAASCMSSIGGPGGPGGSGGPGVGASTRGRDLLLPRERETIAALVPQNATFETLFKQQQVPTSITSTLVTEIRKVFNPRELRANQPYRIVRSL